MNKNKTKGVPIIPQQRIYLVRFVGKAAIVESFLKVGISSLNTSARFQCDLVNYDIELIAISSTTGHDAYLLEQAIHSAYKKDRYRPKARLMSGNTECYRYSEELLRKLSDIVEAC
jgi:hypothetical protein